MAKPPLDFNSTNAHAARLCLDLPGDKYEISGPAAGPYFYECPEAMRLRGPAACGLQLQHATRGNTGKSSKARRPDSLPLAL
jgi:hypothetical protein